MGKRGYVEVSYADGTEERIPLSPFAIMQSERKFGGKMPAFEGTMFAAWCSKAKPGGSFEAWMETLVHAEEKVEGAAAPLDQTQSRSE